MNRPLPIEEREVQNSFFFDDRRGSRRFAQGKLAENKHQTQTKTASYFRRRTFAQYTVAHIECVNSFGVSLIFQ